MMVTIKLKPNATYSERLVNWTRVTKDGYRCAGILEVQESRGVGKKVKPSRYAVQELERVADGRRFMISKPNSEEQYYVQLRDPKKGFCICTCPAGDKGEECKHIQAIVALQAAGHLPAESAKIR